MSGTFDVATLIIVLVGIGVAGFVLRMVVNGFMSFVFVVVVLYVVFAVWVPGPLEPLLHPVQQVLRIPFSLLARSLSVFSTLSVGSGGGHLAFW